MIRKSSSHRKRKRAPITQPVLYHSTPHQATNIANGAFSPICDVSESYKIVPGLSSHTPDQEAQNRVCSSVSHAADFKKSAQHIALSASGSVSATAANTAAYASTVSLPASGYTDSCRPLHPPSLAIPH